MNDARVTPCLRDHRGTLQHGEQVFSSSLRLSLGQDLSEGRTQLVLKLHER